MRNNQPSGRGPAVNDHLRHEPDDVVRRGEPAVGAGGGQFAEDVLVDIALGGNSVKADPSLPASNRESGTHSGERAHRREINLTC